jgi:hypothetical protein
MILDVNVMTKSVAKTLKIFLMMIVRSHDVKDLYGGKMGQGPGPINPLCPPIE